MGLVKMSETSPITIQPETAPEGMLQVSGLPAPIPAAGTGHWDFSLFGCCASPCSTCKVLYCPCCTACDIASSLGKNGCCWGCCLFPECGRFLRTAMREQQGIEGSCFNDFLIWCCCTCCALVQMESQRKAFMARRNQNQN